MRAEIGFVAGMIALGSADAHADECRECPPKEGPRIEVRDWDEYDRLLDLLVIGAPIIEWPDGHGGSSIPMQLFEGMSGVFAPSRTSTGGMKGRVFTTYHAGKGWREDWIVRDPETVMRTPVSLPHLLGFGTADLYADEVATWSDGDEFGRLTFEFEYLCPPDPAMYAQLPTVVPPFVTDVLRFKVFAEKNDVEQEAGALYRERMLVPQLDDAQQLTMVVHWQDTWALWDNFEAPEAGVGSGSGRVVRLEATSWGGEPVKDFLEQQMVVLPGHCVVRTHSDVTPIQP